MTKRKNAGGVGPENGPDAEPGPGTIAETGVETGAEPTASRADAPTSDAAVEDATILDATVLEEVGAADREAVPPQDAGQTRPLDEGAFEPRGGDGPPPSEPPSPGAGSGAGSGSGSGGGVRAGLYGLIGAALGGVIVLFGGEAMRSDGPPAEEIATRAAVTEEIDDRIAALATPIEQGVDAAKETARLDRDLAALREGGSQASLEAKSERAVLAAELEALRDELALERTRITRLNDELAERERTRVAALTAIREQVSALAAAVAATPGGAVAATGVVAEGAEGSGAASAAVGEAASATRLAILEGGIRRLEARVNGLSAEALPTPDLTRIDKLESAERAAAAARAALEARLGGVERRARAVPADAALGRAFAALAQDVAGDEPYLASLKRFQDAAPAALIVDPALEDPAEQGLPSPLALSNRLDAAAWDAIDAAAKARRREGQGDWLDFFSGVFLFRSSADPDDASDDSVEAALARAQQLLDEERDVGAALEAVEGLQRAALAWTAEADEKEEAANALEDAASALLRSGATDSGTKDEIRRNRAEAAASRAEAERLRAEAQVRLAAFKALSAWRRQAGLRAGAEAALTRLRQDLLGDEAAAVRSEPGVER